MIPPTAKNLEEFAVVTRYFSLVTAAKRSADQEDYAQKIAQKHSANPVVAAQPQLNSNQIEAVPSISEATPTIDPVKGNLLDLVA